MKIFRLSLLPVWHCMDAYTGAKWMEYPTLQNNDSFSMRTTLWEFQKSDTTIEKVIICSKILIWILNELFWTVNWILAYRTITQGKENMTQTLMCNKEWAMEFRKKNRFRMIQDSRTFSGWQVLQQVYMGLDVVSCRKYSEWRVRSKQSLHT